MPTTTKKPGSRKKKPTNSNPNNNGKDKPVATTTGAIFDFSAATYAPTDLFSASSSLPETEDNQKEQHLQKIHKQKNSMEVVLANLQLGGMILDGEGQAIRNQIKGAKNLVLEGELAIEGIRLEQTAARSDIETAKLNGLQQDASGYQMMLPIQRQAWELRLEGLQIDVAAGRAMLSEKKKNLQSRFPEIEFDAPPQLPVPGGKPTK